MSESDATETADATEAADADAKGGAGAALGVRVLRYSGVQGASLAIASLLQLVTLFVIAHYLGPSELGRFALLFFVANLLGILITIACKPGTLRRTFGEGDEEDDSDDDDDVAADPRRSLGTGLVMASLLAVVAIAGGVLAREPIADGLLGSTEDADLVILAILMGVATAVFRLVSIVIWFERRPGAFMICELTRPILALGATIVALAAGGGLEAALIAGAGAAVVGIAAGLFLLRGSFDPAFDRVEITEILTRGAIRAPVISSFWVINNADVFILSRFVDTTELGVYTLASRVGFIAAFAPQGFRIAMRPLRKAAIFQAVEDQYGQSVQRGQTLGYFVLVCIAAVVMMALAAPVLVAIAPGSFADAAPLIPLSAAAMVWPALLRTTNQQAKYPDRSPRTVIYAAMFAAAVFVALTFALASPLGVYAAPVAMIGGLVPPCVYLLVRCQRGPDRIQFPYREVGVAALLGGLVGGGFSALPDLPVAAEIGIALVFGLAYIALLLVFRVIPEAHRPALMHIGRSLVSGRPDEFKPRRGLRSLAPDERAELKAAIAASWAAAGTGRGEEVDGDHAALVRTLRRAGERGGMPVGEESPHDEQIARFLFADLPGALRNAALRSLLAEGADAGDLRRLEDLVQHLATVPEGAWRGERKGGGAGQDGPREPERADPGVQP